MTAQQFKLFMRNWFSSDKELDVQINTWLETNPRIKVISFNYTSTAQGDTDALTGERNGSDDVLVMYEEQD